jgi:NAD(P)-dependent dehydrogenase (short-subunit alcohol dehydrogenase family)
MSDVTRFRYDGKRVLVVGGATGMGASAAQTVGDLGAEVIVLDHAAVEFPVAQAIQVDLRDRAAIDDALAQFDGAVDAVFSAAGVADGTPGLMKINFISHRHIVESLIENQRLGRGGAVCFISSVAGLAWESNLEQVKEFLATPDYESAAAWIDEHPGTDTYTFSKQAMNAYVAIQSYPFLKEGVRINAICPGPTDTPLARANADMWLGFAQDYRDDTNTPHLVPQQMGDVMVFLNSEAASGISGVNLLVDTGHVMSSLTGSFAPGELMMKYLTGRA